MDSEFVRAPLYGGFRYTVPSAITFSGNSIYFSISILIEGVTLMKRLLKPRLIKGYCECHGCLTSAPMHADSFAVTHSNDRRSAHSPCCTYVKKKLLDCFRMSVMKGCDSRNETLLQDWTVSIEAI